MSAKQNLKTEKRRRKGEKRGENMTNSFVQNRVLSLSESPEKGENGENTKFGFDKGKDGDQEKEENKEKKDKKLINYLIKDEGDGKQQILNELAEQNDYSDSEDVGLMDPLHSSPENVVKGQTTDDEFKVKAKPQSNLEKKLNALLTHNQENEKASSQPTNSLREERDIHLTSESEPSEIKSEPMDLIQAAQPPQESSLYSFKKKDTHDDSNGKKVSGFKDDVTTVTMEKPERREEVNSVYRKNSL